MRNAIAPVYLLLIAFSSQQLCAQEPADPYAGLSPVAAKAKFERKALAVRWQLREDIGTAARELEAWVQKGELDKQSQLVVQELATLLKAIDDPTTAFERVAQSRTALKPPDRERLEMITSDLAQHWQLYQQCKLEYQPAAGRSLAERWTSLSLETKRSELSDYLALSDSRPMWLLRHSAVTPAEVLSKPTQTPITEYQARLSDLINQIQKELQPAIDTTTKIARQTAESTKYSQAERMASVTIAEALTATYGRSLRGVMICVPSRNLPENLRASVRALLLQFIEKVNEHKTAHQLLLDRLHTAMELGVGQRKLEEQFVIDMRVAEVEPFVQPLRVLAKRSSRVDFFEEAKLLELIYDKERFRYRVEFTIDGVTRWVEVDEILAKSPDAIKMSQHKAPPPDGPGQAVTDATDLASGQVFGYSPAGWKPLVFVDESALGVIARWQGGSEPVEHYFTREELRIVSSPSQ